VTIPQSAYERLLALRTGLRHFLRWSEQQAAEVGLTAAQHQLLLAIKGHSDPRGPTIGEVADYLLLRHHSAVGLVDRAEAAGLISRQRDEDDRRVVRLQLTPESAARLEQLSALHIEELERLAAEIGSISEGLAPLHEAHGLQRAQEVRAATAARRVGLARVWDESLRSDRRRKVLVDRLWPRGIRRDEAAFDDWRKEVAPSTELRRWYGHDPDRFTEFARRYRVELGSEPASGALDALLDGSPAEGLTLVTATKDLERSGAAVLAEVAEERLEGRVASPDAGRHLRRSRVRSQVSRKPPRRV